MEGKLFIVSAPSGAGKTSLVDEILARLMPQYPIDRLVTYTSREIRGGEKHGKDFFFVSPKEFEMRVQQGFFIEWSNEYGHYYGSPKQVQKDLQDGMSRVLVIDRKGAKQVVEHIKKPVLIWIYTHGLDVLKNRLLKRGKNSSEQIEKRLKIAKFELEEEQKNKFYRHHILNDIFADAAASLESVFVSELLNRST